MSEEYPKQEAHICNECCNECCEAEETETEEPKSEETETEEIESKEAKTEVLKAEESEVEELESEKSETSAPENSESENQEKITVTNSMDVQGRSFSLFPGNRKVDQDLWTMTTNAAMAAEFA